MRRPKVLPVIQLHPSNPPPLYNHQKQDFARYKDESVMPIYWEMGCVSAGTVVTFGIKAASHKCTVAEAYRRFHKGKNERKYYVRSFLDGYFGQNEVADIVYQGKKPVYLLVLNDGKALRATTDHEILTQKGYVRLDRLVKGDLVVCNGRGVYDHNERVHNEMLRRGEHRGYDKDGYVYLTGGERVFQYLQRHPGKILHCGPLEHRVVMEELLGRSLESWELVHHINGIKDDNDPSNLMLVDSREHSITHNNWKNLYSKDFIKADGTVIIQVPKLVGVHHIEEVGIDDVYDIKIATEYHNFIADGIVVHNCGKSALALAIARYKYQQGLINSLLIIAPNEVHCIAGSSIVYYKHLTSIRPITIEHLYRLYKDKYSRYNMQSREYFVRGLSSDGYFDYVPVQDILYKGKQECLKITTDEGHSLVCTKEHKVLTKDCSYVEASELAPGQQLVMNGERVCCVCGTNVNLIGLDRYGHRRKWTGYCKSCAYSLASQDRRKWVGSCMHCGRQAGLVIDKDSKYHGWCMACINIDSHQRNDYERIDAAGYVVVGGPQTRGKHTSKNGEQRKHRWLMENHLGRKLKENEHVHHIDGNKLNNDLSNLEVLTPREHALRHKEESTRRLLDANGKPLSLMKPHIEKVVSIIYAGVQDVYDIMCDEPHNFVADHFVVHNCQWHSEQIPKWLGVSYQSQCLYGRGGQKDTYPFDSTLNTLNIICVNVDTFSRGEKWKEIAEWCNSTKSMIVLDEVTCIKNYESNRTKNILYMCNHNMYNGKKLIASKPKTVARMVLTGTPVTNGPMDLWSIMEFLKPNFFGLNRDQFKGRYAMCVRMITEGSGGRPVEFLLTEGIWEAVKEIYDYNVAYYIFGVSLDTFNLIHRQERYSGPYKNADELKRLLDRVASFRKLTDCRDMPKQNYNTKYLPMSDEIAQCYEDMETDFQAKYADHQMQALSKISMWTRLAQISSGFLYDKDYGEGEDITPDDAVQWIGRTNPKLEALKRDLAEASKPVIIATRFSAEAKRIYDELKDTYKTCLITGWKCIGSIDEYKEGKYDVMVANSVKIHRGHNLQNGHTIFIYSNTFSLEVRLQLEGRIFRIGQTEPCEYVDYCYRDTVDERIVNALINKQDLLDYIRSSKGVK